MWTTCARSGPCYSGWPACSSCHHMALFARLRLALRPSLHGGTGKQVGSVVCTGTDKGFAASCKCTGIRAGMHNSWRFGCHIQWLRYLRLVHASKHDEVAGKLNEQSTSTSISAGKRCTKHDITRGLPRVSSPRVLGRQRETDCYLVHRPNGF